MKKILSIFMILFSISAFSQTLKTFKGPFKDGKLQNGNAVYTYYEDPETHEYLKHGTFKYTFNGKGDYQGFNQTITGNFEKGLKTGTWTYSTIMTDFGIDTYFTGTVTLVANYKNGYADGNWKEVLSYKTKKRYNSYGPVKTTTINMNFKNGYMVGAVNINDEFTNFKVTGSYDNNSLCTGTWIINDMNWDINRELIYKDNFLYEFIARNNSGAVKKGSEKYQIDYDNYIKAKKMTVTEREEAGLTIDTICGSTLNVITNHIDEYLSKLLNVEYFLYNYIGGDLSYKEGFKGGCDIKVTIKEFTPLANIYEFSQAEAYYGENDLLRAYELYSKIKLDIIKPSERKIVVEKMAILSPKVDSLLDTYYKNSAFFPEYIKSQHDSLDADFKTIKQKFKIKNIKEYNKNTRKYEEKELKVPMYGYDCEKPWDEDYSIAIQCFKLNKDFYEPYQIAITEYYNKFKEVLREEESNVKQSQTSFKYNTFYTYDKDKFLLNISIAKNNYEKSKLMMALAIKFEEKSKHIETLNSQNKKNKILFKKYNIVFQDYQKKYNAYPELDKCIKILNESVVFFDKVIELYSTDTKDINKQLKNAEAIEQIIKIIIK